MTLPLWVFVVAVAVGAGSFCLGLFVLRPGVRIWLQDPDRTVDATEGGRIELEGTATPADGSATAPFSGADCLLCRATVLEDNTPGKGPDWKKVERLDVTNQFHLQDDAGSVLVVPDGATVHLDVTADVDVGADETPPDRIREYLRERSTLDVEDEGDGAERRGPSADADRRYVEKRLDVGDRVHVVGTTRHPDDPPAPLGSVDAVVAAPDVGERSLVGQVRRRMAGVPFTITGASEGEAAWRVAKPGVALAATGVIVLAAVAVFELPVP